MYSIYKTKHQYNVTDQKCIQILKKTMYQCLVILQNINKLQNDVSIFCYPSKCKQITKRCFNIM